MSNKFIELYKELENRELLNNVTDKEKLQSAVANGAAFYLGIDPTGNSLHLGHYISLNLIKILAKYGLKPVLVFGGATGMIGDPSGKSVERVLLDEKTIAANVDSISKQVSNILKGIEFKTINNYEFYKDMNVITFLREVGKHFNLSELIHRDIIKDRLSTGISVTESLYSLLQGYDFLQLSLKHKVELQIGGSDQWTNILSGLDLIKKQNPNANAVGVTINLLLDENGNKFGKTSLGKTMFINPELTSSYEMYQFLFNLSDEKATELIKKLTINGYLELDKLLEEHKATPSKRILQHKLAKEIFESIYAKGEYEQNELISSQLFREEFDKLSQKDITSISKTFEVVKVKNEQLIIDVFASLDEKRLISKTNFRKFLTQGAVKVNGHVNKEESTKFGDIKFLFDKFAFIKIGKKHILFEK